MYLKEKARVGKGGVPKIVDSPIVGPQIWAKARFPV